MERNLISHDVIANPSQFIAQRLGGKTRICLSHFSVIIASELFMVSSGQVGGLGEGPAQIAIAVFKVAMALDFAVREPLGRYTPAIGSKVPHSGKTADIPHFQHNGHGQDHADAGDRHQWLKCLMELYFPFVWLFPVDESAGSETRSPLNWPVRRERYVSLSGVPSNL
jgi:hypothetical protein